MDTINLKDIGVVEMNFDETIKTDGGIILIIGFAVGVYAGYKITEAIDEHLL